MTTTPIPMARQAGVAYTLRCQASLLICPPPQDAPQLLRSLPGARCDQADPSRCPWCLHPGPDQDGSPEGGRRGVRVFF